MAQGSTAGEYQSCDLELMWLTSKLLSLTAVLPGFPGCALGLLGLVMGVVTLPYLHLGGRVQAGKGFFKM